MSGKGKCKIGQKDRCILQGCSWKKAFGEDCTALQKKQLANPLKDAMDKIKDTKISYRLPEDLSSFIPRKVRKRSKKESEEPKHFSEFTNNVYNFLAKNVTVLGEQPKKKKKKKKSKKNQYSEFRERIGNPLKCTDEELFSKIGIAQSDDIFARIKII